MDTADSAPARLAPRQFEDFYRTRRAQVFKGLTITLRDRDLAADATDEAMARAFQNWRSVRNYRNPEGWTFRVGLNWARSRQRKSKREVPGFRISDRPSVEVQQSDPSLMAAVARLPIEQRAVVVLRYLFDWSTQDVAKALNVSQGTVKSRLSRALDRLENHMEVR